MAKRVEKMCIICMIEHPVLVRVVMADREVHLCIECARTLKYALSELDEAS